MRSGQHVESRRLGVLWRGRADAPRRASVHLPDRYGDGLGPFEALIAPDLAPGAAILDVGSGRRPAVPASDRPPGCRYVGLDVSRGELEAAPTASYDELVVGDILQRETALEERFDLVVSWQVFEHVKPLRVALENIRAYLRPGGQLVAQLSGRFAIFALVGRAVPQGAGERLMQRLLDRDPETVFPAYYDGCYHGALTHMLEPWSDWRIIPRYEGAQYLRFAPILQRAYLGYENWAERNGHLNLATHYLVSARR